MMDDSIGVDVSKDNLDVHRLSDGTSARFANTSAGFRALTKWLGAVPPARVVHEPTGPYHAAFETRFAGRLPLVKVNPLQARRFAQSKGLRAKTDRVDARMLAVMGAAFALEPDRPMSQNLRDLKELRIARTALVPAQHWSPHSIGQGQNPSEEPSADPDAGLCRQAGEGPPGPGLAPVARHRRRNQRLHCARSTDRAAARHPAQGPGIGAVTAAAILIECPEVGTMTGKQIASLSGLLPALRLRFGRSTLMNVHWTFIRARLTP